MTGVIEVTLIAGAPLLLAVLGELVLQRSGALNIGLEGTMLAAAFGAAMGATMGGSVIAGIGGAITGAAIPSVVFGLLVFHRRIDAIVVGVAMNLVAAGGTTLLYQHPETGRRLAGGRPSFPKLEILGVGVDPLILFAWLAAPLLIGALIWKSRPGLRLRAAGENPESLSYGGFPVARYRWMALGVETVLAGLAGAAVAIGLAHGFAENMIAGRGFIALSIVIFARWSVSGAVGGVALFALATALQYGAQAGGAGGGYQIFLAFPYVLTLMILLAVPGIVRAPAALGK